MEKREKVLKSWSELKTLWAERGLITYEELGNKIDTHYRQVGKIVGVVQAAIEVYNLKYGTKVPHINALVVNKRSQKPGGGCLTEKPSVIHMFNYTPVFDGIESILNFISHEIYESYFKNLDWEELAPTFLCLYERSEKLAKLFEGKGIK
jgi:hypothetical protein